MIIKAGFFTLALLFYSSASASNTIPFAWTPNPPSENVTGYRLYYGTKSRFDIGGNEKLNFAYDHYIDFGTSMHCSGLNYDNCTILSSADFNCNYDSGPIATCTITDPGGINYYSLKAYNDYEFSGFSAELSHPDYNPSSLQSMFQLLLLSEN